jgi:hypothetical protein
MHLIVTEDSSRLACRQTVNDVYMKYNAYLWLYDSFVFTKIVPAAVSKHETILAQR